MQMSSLILRWLKLKQLHHFKQGVNIAMAKNYIYYTVWVLDFLFTVTVSGIWTPLLVVFPELNENKEKTRSRILEKWSEKNANSA